MNDIKEFKESMDNWMAKISKEQYEKLENQVIRQLGYDEMERIRNLAKEVK